MNNDLYRIMLSAFLMASLGCNYALGESNGAETSNAPTNRLSKDTAIERVAFISKRVAQGIEALKSKYPHLATFNSSEHLHENVVKAGFLPGTPTNPELFSISYFNGIVGEKAPPKNSGKRSAEYIFDPNIGIRLWIHFFKGDARGCDIRPPQKIGNLSVHLYVEGPAADAIRADIQQMLYVLQNEYKQDDTQQSGAGYPPQGVGSPDP